MKKKAIYIGLAIAFMVPFVASAARTQSDWLIDPGNTYISPASAPINVLIQGPNRYLNFGTFSGSSGYGFRDNGGTMEFKNNAGSWTGVGTGGGGTNFLTSSGSNTYLNTGSNLQAPSVQATSTSGTSSFNGSVSIAPSSSLGPNVLITNASTTANNPIGIVDSVDLGIAQTHATIVAPVLRGGDQGPDNTYSIFGGSWDGHIWEIPDPEGNFHSFVSVPALGGNQIVQVTYATTTQFLYFVDSANNIIQVDPNYIYSQKIVYTGTGGNVLGFHPSIATDGNYLYVATYTSGANIIKISLSNFSTVQNVPIAGAANAHAIIIDPTLTYAYVTTVGGQIAKISLANLSTQTLISPGLLYTDDPALLNGTLYAGGESGGITKVTVSTMAYTNFGSHGSYGIWSDGTNIYNTSNSGSPSGGGFLDLYPNGNLSTVYSYIFPGVLPNELYVTPNNNFIVTDWTSTKVYKVTFNKDTIINPSFNGASSQVQDIHGNLNVGQVYGDVSHAIGNWWAELTVGSGATPGQIIQNTNAENVNFTNGLSLSGGKLSNTAGTLLSGSTTAATPRGPFDLHGASSWLDITGGIIAPIYPTGNFPNNQLNVMDFDIYAYSLVNGNYYYSSNPQYLAFNEDAGGDHSGTPYYLKMQWNAVPGATGYFIKILDDGYDGYFGDHYIATTTTSILYGTGNELLATAGNLPGITASAGDLYIDASGAFIDVSTATGTIPNLSSTIIKATTICLTTCISSFSASLTSLTATWPIISSGGTTPNLTWGGLATSSNPTIGGVAYWTGTKNLGSAATSTLASSASSLLITGSPAILGPAANIDFNLAHPNFWTALQNFTNASTSQLTATSSVYFETSGGVGGVATSTPVGAWDVNGGIYSENVNPSTTTSMTVDFSTANNNQTIKVGTANIAVSLTNANKVVGKTIVFNVVAPAAGNIGSTTFSGGSGSGSTVWEGGINLGNSVVNGTTDVFCLTSMASSTNFIGEGLCGSY